MSPPAARRACISAPAAVIPCGVSVTRPLDGPQVEPATDGIYRYFKGRADGSIGAEDRPA